MKSYFLCGLHDESAISAGLSELLPKGAANWLLLSNAGDAIAYFNIETEEVGPEIHVHISGRHYYEDEKVINLLRILKSRLGGVIVDDFENILI
jgi:hypothetical protein